MPHHLLGPVPRMAGHLVSLSLCSAICPHAPGLKTSINIYFLDAYTLHGYSSVTHLVHTIHIAFPQSFVYLTTQVHLVLEIHELTLPLKG